MQLTRVASSMIYAVGYDEQTQTLEVVFYTTGVYRYFGVPKDVYNGLLESSSKGSYMRSSVIDCYTYEHVRNGR